MQPAPRAPHPARAARSCGRNLLNRLLPRAPATAGSPIPRRRGRTGPDASFPAARVAAVPQPDSRSPVPAAGPLTCTCLRKWRGPGTASGQKQQQQQQRGWPRHLAHGTTREPALGAPSVRPSVSRCRLPTRFSGTRAGCSWSHVALAKPQPGSWSAPAAPATEAPSFPPSRLPAPPPPPLNSSNGSSPAEPRARAAALQPP